MSDLFDRRHGLLAYSSGYRFTMASPRKSVPQARDNGPIVVSHWRSEPYALRRSEPRERRPAASAVGSQDVLSDLPCTRHYALTSQPGRYSLAMSFWASALSALSVEPSQPNLVPLR